MSSQLREREQFDLFFHQVSSKNSYLRQQYVVVALRIFYLAASLLVSRTPSSPGRSSLTTATE